MITIISLSLLIALGSFFKTLGLVVCTNFSIKNCVIKITCMHTMHGTLITQHVVHTNFSDDVM